MSRRIARRSEARSPAYTDVINRKSSKWRKRNVGANHASRTAVSEMNGALVNPLYAIAKPMAVSSRAEVSLVENLWLAFNKYVTLLIDEDKREARIRRAVVSAVERTEKVAQQLAKILSDRSSSDEYVEAGALAYFILTKQGIAKRYPEFTEALRRRVHVCVEDESYGLASATSSPALSRCLGIGHATLDLLDKHDRAHLEELFERLCVKESDTATVFCIYSVFGKALRAMLSKSKEEAKLIALNVEMVGKRPWLTLEQIALILIAYGVATRVSGEKANTGLIYQLAERMYERIRSGVNFWNARRKLWVEISLALKLNNLDRIQLVYADRVTVEREKLEKLREDLDSIALFLEKWWRAAELALGIAGVISSVVASIPAGVFAQLGYIAPALVTTLLIAIAVETWVSWATSRRIRETKEYLDKLLATGIPEIRGGRRHELR